jgi:hypothetical protein
LSTFKPFKLLKEGISKKYSAQKMGAKSLLKLKLTTALQCMYDFHSSLCPGGILTPIVCSSGGRDDH